MNEDAGAISLDRERERCIDKGQWNVVILLDELQQRRNEEKWREHCRMHPVGCSCFDCVGAHINVEERNAKAAKWDAATQGGRVAVSGLSNVVMAIELAQLRANDRRWRTVERAVESGVGFRAWKPVTLDGLYFAEAISRDYEGCAAHEPTLAAAVDALGERMDTEGAP